MTDTLTCAQINKEVALHLGWKQRQHGWCSPKPWFPGTKWHSTIPDSCGEWQHAGPLWEKLAGMCDKRLDYEEMLVRTFLPCWTDRMPETEAITRAYHAAIVKEGK